MWRSSCLGRATGFLRTAKGTIWPLCEACSEHHKTITVQSISKGHLPANSLVDAEFDIPLDDPETLVAYKQQGQSTIREIQGDAAELWNELHRPSEGS